MDLLYRIACSLPDSNDIMAVNTVMDKLSDLFTTYQLELHGSWLMDLAFEDSDVDVAVIASEKKFKKILEQIQSRLTKRRFSCLSIRNNIVANADMKVIPMIYDTGRRTVSGSPVYMDIDITIQTRARLASVFHLRDILNQYEFHDLYRSVKIILRDNHLYGHKVGGLNSFSIGWMIVAMIEYYRAYSNLLDLHPDWFKSRDDESHTYTLLWMFCDFYVRVHKEKKLLRLTACESGKLGKLGKQYRLEMENVRLSFDNWKDVKQPWLPRLYLEDNWVTGKTWRYNYILALFNTIHHEGHAKYNEDIEQYST